MKPTVVPAAALDALAIVVFVMIGRSSHTEGEALAGVVSTAWPFMVGAALGWLVGRVWKRPMSLAPGAFWVWSTTVVVGMILRVIAGQGTAAAFIVVAFGFLGLSFFGWRLVYALVTKRRRAPSRHGSGQQAQP